MPKKRSLSRNSFISAAPAGPAMLEALEPRLLLSLVAHLELNETSGTTAADTVSDHDGTRYGDAVWDDGRIDNGAYLDAGDYISVANSDDFNFGASDSFTVSTWVRNDGSGNWGIAVYRGNISYGANTGPGFFIGQNGTSVGSYIFTLGDGTHGTYTTLTPPETDGYHLLTMVVDRSTDEMRCYADGTLLSTKDISSIGSVDSGNDMMQIGGNAWTGMIDDVRVYDHALSTSDVEDLYEDAPTWITLYADDAIATEGDDGGVIRALRTGSLDGAITVNYSVSGTASSADYSETLGGTVTIGDGESYADITVTAIDDATSEGREALTLTLASGTGYTAGLTDEATVVIYDADDLMMHLKLDETSGSTAADDTGNGHTGTRYGDTVWDDGQIDNGAYFETGDSIAVDNSEDFNFGASDSFTVSAWVRNDGSGNWGTVALHGASSYGSSHGPGFFIGQYGTTVGAYIFTLGDGSTGTYNTLSLSGADDFHLLTMVVDRSAQEMRGYADGALAFTKDISSIGSVDSGDDVLQLGGNAWTGMIDDVRVYNYALDSTAILDLYEVTMPPVSIVAVDSMAFEDSADTAVFRVSRTGTSGALTVNYSVSGTATSADYSETLGGTVTIADGNSYADITITPVDDATGESPETLILTLASGTGYKPGEVDEATVTIYDAGELMMHLKLDETSGSTAADDTGNGHTGTLVGDTAWDDGRINNGAYFEPGDSIAVDDTEDFNFGASDSFTVSSWVRNDGSGNWGIVAYRGGLSYGASHGPGFFIGQFGTLVGTYMFTLGDGTHGTYNTLSLPYGGDYHLLTMVVDRSAQEMRAYADGVLAFTQDISSIGSLDCDDDILQVGGNAWTGMIDDVRVYNYALSGTDVGSLYDDAPTWITLYTDNAIATEEAVAGTDSGVVRVVRTGSVGEALTVNYSVSGTASSADYSETLGGTVTFEVGQREAEIVITPVADGTADGGETVTITLASGTGYMPSEIDAGTVTIYDEAGLLAHWKMDETSGSTVSDATGNGFTATRVGDTVWDYGRVANGAYFDLNDSITLADAADLDFGGDQSFAISAWVRYNGTTSSPAAVSKGSETIHYSGSELGWGMGRYSAGSFAFGVGDGTAGVQYITPGVYDDDDFHLMTMVVDRGADVLRCFLDGDLLAQEDISSLGSLAVWDEPFYIGLGKYSYWGGMIDDVRVYDYALSVNDVADLYADAPPVVSVAAVDSTGSETGSEPATFRVTREGPTAEALEVNYTVTGTAAGADYSETFSGTVTIAAGESYADVTVTPVDDASNEGDETVIVTLTPSATDAYSILTTTEGTATVTIGDSDNVAGPQVVIGMADSEASEVDNDTATFRIYRSGATTSDLAVNYTVSGTAEGDDYSETLSGTVTIASGNSYADITITPITDENFEYPEALVLTLVEDAGYSIGLSDNASAVIYDIPFSEQLNPTGDPIGGSIGYSDIIDIGDADYVVDTAQELVDALSSATYGDIIYVEDDAEIDLTGYVADTYYNALLIPAGVTLASGRGNNGSQGGLIYTTDEWTDANRVAMLGTGGDDVRITGLRLRGPSGYQLEIHDGYGYYASGIRCATNLGTLAERKHKNIEVDNCEIYDWTMAGVYVMYGEGVNVHHNHIHTNIGEGYAYGIWFGALSELSAEWAAEANANLFDCNRHDIGASCHWPYAARYNIFGPNQYQQLLDRHSGYALDTWIENNWMQGDDVEFRCAFVFENDATVYYNDNWTPKEAVGPGWIDVCIFAPTWPPVFDTEASGNTFSFDEYDDPYTPVSDTDVTYLSTPYTVSFDSSDSYDPEGLDILSHEWWFGDGFGDAQGVMSIEDNPTYTYSDAGLYEVAHYTYNEYGVPGYDYTDVIVRPEDGGYWLSAWVHGGCAVNTVADNTYMKILVGENVVWSDDISDRDGWQHVVVDITSYVTEGTGVLLSFELESDGGYYVAMGVDNVYIFGGDVGDSHFDSNDIWNTYDPDDGASSWNCLPRSARAGRLSTTGAKLVDWGQAGTGRLYQVVPIGKALEAMVTDDFESGDGTGGDNWDANWVLTGSAAVTSSGTPYDGTYHLLLTGSSAVASRAVDLSDFGDATTLSFEYKADSFETGEYVTVEIYDGTQWQEVMVIEDGDDDGEYHLASIDLSGYSLTDDFEVRFTAGLADAGDFFYVDDLMIA